MKKSTAQISIAIVCALLGFLLAYQFKLLSKNNDGTTENYNKNDIITEIDSLKKEKEELQNKNNAIITIIPSGLTIFPRAINTALIANHKILFSLSINIYNPMYINKVAKC